MGSNRDDRKVCAPRVSHGRRSRHRQILQYQKPVAMLQPSRWGWRGVGQFKTTSGKLEEAFDRVKNDETSEKFN